MRLHILGAGAIGRVFANRMIRAGVETTLLLRPVRVEALKRSGRMTDAIVQEKKVEVQVENVLWKEHRLERTETTLVPFDFADESGTDFIETVLVLTKANDAMEALESIRPRLAEDSVVMLLCNGSLALEDELARSTLSVAGAHRIFFVSGVTMQGAFRRTEEEAGHPFGAVDAGGQGCCWFGLTNEGYGYSPAAIVRYKRCLDMMNLANLKAHDETEQNAIRHRLWMKLGVNCVMNAHTSILQVRNGLFLDAPSALDSIQRVCTEVAKVSAFDPYCSPSLDAKELAEFIINTVNRHNHSSMNQDISARRPTEIDYINGYVVEKALAAGIEAPANATLAALVKMKEEINLIS
jgi:2-dehydropantoate 2-reductase